MNEQTIRGSFKAITKTGSRLALRVGTEFEDTWLGDPIESIGEQDGCWDIKKLVFQKNFDYVPEDSFALHPKRLPIKFASKEQGEFFKDKTLLPGGGGKAILDSGIFSPNRVSCESEFNRIENFSRQSILENEVLNSNSGFCADSLVGMTEILKELKNGKISKPKKAWEKVFENIDNITQFMDLVRQTNYRATYFSIATCVSAKKVIRQYILNKYNGTENIKEKL